jgi:hypothetical protein
MESIEEVHHICVCGQHDVIKLPNLISKQRLKEAIDNLEKKLNVSLERHGIRKDLRIAIIGRNLLKFETELEL